MAQDPESRPISVSELLARSRREADDEQSSSPESGRFPAAGRRRVGRDGSMSVAELTGEIPKITGPIGATGSETGPQPAATATPGVQPRATAPTTRGSSAFPRSSSPAPTSTTGAGRTASGMPGIRPSSAPTPADAQTEVTTPVVDAPPPVDGNANAITGIIPLVDDAASDDDLDFEAYRNFADYETDESAGQGRKDKKDKPKKEKRGLFGRKKSDERNRAASSAAEAAPASGAFAAPEPIVDDAPSDPLPAVRRSTAAESGPAIVPSVRRSVTPPQSGEDAGPAITPHVVARAPEAPAEPVDTDRRAAVRPRPETAADDTQEIGVVASSVTPAITPSKRLAEPAVTPSEPLGHDDIDDFDDVPPAEEPHKVRASLRKAISDDTEAGDIPDEAPLSSKHSPVVQWLLLIGQTIVGLAVGAGLFWGFTELWKWNVIFALVLAAVVIFGIVTLVHVVRRRHDLISTLLALGVGLIVTIGPLVLLASSST